MKKLTFKQLLIINLSLLTILLSGCKKDKDNNDNLLNLKSGVFITNEGQLSKGSGTVSFFDRDDHTVKQDIFNTVNNKSLGNIVQSLEIFNGKAYIVVNNAGKVEVVDAITFKSTGVISGLTSPRYFLGIDANKAYISDWPNDIAVVDLKSFTIQKKIYSGIGPNHMLLYDNKAFVLNMYNSTTNSYDSTLTIMDTKADTIIKKIQIFNVPSGICIDKNNKIWILCSGRGWNGFPQNTDSKGHLLRLNPITFTIEKDLVFPSLDKHPDKLAINKSNDVLYYSYVDGVYSFGINDNDLKTTPFIKLSKLFYGMGYDKITDMIYGTDAVDYTQNGWVFRYKADNGAKVDSFKVGVNPGNFYFK
jgi:hypothetical protein